MSTYLENKKDIGLHQFLIEWLGIKKYSRIEKTISVNGKKFKFE